MIRADYALTRSQRAHLQKMAEAAAFDRRRAVTSNDSRVIGFLNPLVIGILIDKGFAEKATRTVSRRTLTIYWLTAEGRAKAGELAA